MKILQICPYLFPALSYGGPGKFAYELSRELAYQHQVTVLTSDSFDATRRLTSKEKTEIIDRQHLTILHFPNLINSWAFRYKLFTHFGVVWWYLRNGSRFDLVHLHDVYIFPQIAIFFLAKLKGQKVVISPHGVLDPIRLERLGLVKNLLNRLIIFPMLSQADLLIALNKSEAKFLQQLGSVRIKILPNGVRENKDPYLLTSEDLPILKLLYIGRLHEKKGLMELVEAMTNLSLPLELTLAGPDDGIENQLRQKIENNKLDNIKLIGFVNRPQKKQLFKQHHLFVYPSHSEGFSVAIIEAMSHGLPVLITEACHFDQVEDHQAGWVVPVKNLAPALRAKLKQIYQQRSKLKQMSENAYHLASTEYSIVVSARRHAKLYQQLLDS